MHRALVPIIGIVAIATLSATGGYFIAAHQLRQERIGLVWRLLETDIIDCEFRNRQKVASQACPEWLLKRYEFELAQLQRENPKIRVPLKRSGKREIEVAPSEAVREMRRAIKQARKALSASSAS